MTTDNGTRVDSGQRVRLSQSVRDWLAELPTDDRVSAYESLEEITSSESPATSFAVTDVDDDVRLTVVPGGKFSVIWSPSSDGVIDVLYMRPQDELPAMVTDSDEIEVVGPDATIPSEAAVNLLQAHGFEIASTSRRHSILLRKKGDRSWVTVVPRGAPLSKKMLKSIGRQAGVDLTELTRSS